MLICPKCREKLISDGRSMTCPNRHCYDMAKSGYVNLLPSNQTHSKLPGDNKIMVQARRAFLNKGYYSILLEALCKKVMEYAGASCKILDAGCGEGYYTSGIAEATKNISAEIIGIDISKNAADYAARRTKAAAFAVASVFHLPIETESVDILTSLFAPFCGEEFIRVLKPGGIMIMVIPSARHLWQLKCAVYEKPYLNEIKDLAIQGFELLSRDAVIDEISLDNSEDINALFSMTPYFYKTDTAGMERLAALDSLTTETGFEILTYRRF